MLTIFVCFFVIQGLSHFLKNITFHGILMDSLFNAESKELEAVNRCMDEGMKTGVVQPLRSTVFEKEAVEEAFRYMASGKHIGKVLIKVSVDLNKLTQITAQFYHASV